MIDETRRPSLLGGLWTFLVGGVGITLLLVALDPISNREDCPNFGGNGNASAFANPAWDLYLLLLLLLWVVLVIGEQFLPTAWRNRGRVAFGIRAVIAIGVSVTASCFFYLPLALLCH